METTVIKFYTIKQNFLDSAEESFSDQPGNLQILVITGCYTDVFSSGLPAVFTPKRSVDHKITTHSEDTNELRGT